MQSTDTLHTIEDIAPEEAVAYCANEGSIRLHQSYSEAVKSREIRRRLREIGTVYALQYFSTIDQRHLIV